MQLLNSKILSNDKITRYSNKKAQDTQYLVLFVCCSFFVQQRWCPRPDLNRHDFFNRRILNPLRLPIPPRGHKNIKFVLKCEFLTIRKILSPVRPSILRKSYCYEKQYNFIINPKKLQSNFKSHRNYSIII